MSLPFNNLQVKHASKFMMVPLGRIELPTSSLPMTRSTTELQRPLKDRPDRGLILCQNGAEDATAFDMVQALFQKYLQFRKNALKLS